MEREKCICGKSRAAFDFKEERATFCGAAMKKVERGGPLYTEKPGSDNFAEIL